MYPRTLFEPDLKSKAEKKVFEALERDLDDEWEVFHSAAWIIRESVIGMPSSVEISPASSSPRSASLAPIATHSCARS